MSKKKILKIIGIVLLVIIIIFLIYTIRNYIIISNLQNKMSNYSNSTNYYTKSVTTESDASVVTMKYYKKNNKEVVFIERNLNGEISKISMYNNGERKDTFWDNKDSKVAKLNSDGLMAVNIYNGIETDNKWQTFLGGMLASIKSTNCDGKECYRIKGFLSTTLLNTKESEVYIEKDTGLYLKRIDEGITSEREYEFDNVDDSIFVEPDISQYTLKENE